MIKNVCKFIVSICTHISPTLGCRIIYFIKFKRILNLKNPVYFNEKLMWLKLNDYNHNNNVWTCSDKYTMRKYCLDKGIKEENLSKLIGVYGNIDEIDFNKLPKKFALKCTHGMGFNIICEDKEKIDIVKTKKKLDIWQKKKFGYESAETHYTHIEPKIICEEFIENEKNEYPIDYKIYCFNGKPKIVLVCTNRKTHYQTTFFDLNWNNLHLRESETNLILEKPKQFEEMIEISKNLSKEFKFVRVDFYEHNGKAILGELTFTPAACLGIYIKEESKKMGDMLDLGKKEYHKQRKKSINNNCSIICKITKHAKKGKSKH